MHARSPCSSAPLTPASSALRRYSASASGEPKRRPGAASGPWWLSTQCSSATRRSGASAGEPRLEQLLAEHDVAEQPALVGEPDLGAVGELARLAQVVHERRGDQQVGVQPRVQLAGLERERADRDGVLEQAAEVGVVAAARARRAAPLGAQRGVAEQALQQRAVAGLVDLAREVLEEAVELVEVAVGDGQERGRVGAVARSIARTSTCSSSRKRSTRPWTRTRSPRSKRPPSRSASRNTRAGSAVVRSRSSSAR